MNYIKQRAHSILEAIIHNVAKSGEDRQTTLTVPYYELLRELGFGEPAPGLNLKLTITAEFIDDDGEHYGTKKESAFKSKISN